MVDTNNLQYLIDLGKREMERRDKIKTKLKGRTLSEEHKKNLSKTLKGTTKNRPFLTEEHKRKLKETLSVKVECPHCGFKTSKSWIKRHIKKCEEKLNE